MLVGRHAYELGIQVQQGPLLLYLLTKSFDSAFLSARVMETVSCLSSVPETPKSIWNYISAQQPQVKTQNQALC